MLKKDTKANRIMRLALPSVITLAVLLIISATKGIVPFGDNRVFMYDMPLGDFPALVYMNDILHGKANLFYNWFTTVGAGRESIVGFFDPITIIMSLLPRSALVDASTLWVLLYFVATAFTAGLFFQTVFKKLAYPWQLLFALLYTLSGYTLRYYTNASFMLYVAVFPLLLLALKKLFDSGNYLPYIICLTYILISSVYFAYFTVLFLIFVGGLYLICFYEKDERKLMSLRLGVGTGASLLISAGFFVPSLINLLTGARFSQSVGAASVANTAAASSTAASSLISQSASGLGGVFESVKAIILTPNHNDANKVLMLISIEAAVMALILLLVKFKKDKKRVLFFEGAALLMLLQIPFENINLLWHGGTYNGYSMRFGYMSVLVLLTALAYYLSTVDSERDRPEKNRAIMYAKTIAAFVLSLVAAAYVSVNKDNIRSIGVLNYSNGPMGNSATRSYLYAFIFVAVLFLALQLFTVKKVRNTLTALLMSVLMIFYSVWFFGYHSKVYSKDNGYFMETVSGFSDELTEKNGLVRVKDGDFTLSMNYPYGLSRASLGGWTHTIDVNTKSAYAALGYGAEYTVMTDAGGTAFSDTLFGVRDYLFKDEPDSSLYSFRKQLSDGYSLYGSNYSLPFGSLFGDDLTSTEFDGNLFEYQNSISESLLNGKMLFSQAEILSSKEHTEKLRIPLGEYTNLEGEGIDTDCKVMEYTLHMPENSVLYMGGSSIDSRVDDTVSASEFRIIVNGEALIVPVFSSADNDLYPEIMNNGIQCLGSFNDETVTVRIENLGASQESEFDELLFYTMDTAALDELCSSAESPVTDYSASGTHISIKTDGSKDGWMFIPLRYSEDWSCVADGERHEIKKALGAFMAVYYEAGTTELTFTYTPSSTIRSFAFFFAALTAVALLFILARREKYVPSKKLCTLFFTAFIAVFSLAVFFFYAVPLAAQVIMIFM